MTSRNCADQYCGPLDGLRAVAVVAVILCHFNKALLPSGYLGVDVFFVISGFVITASLVKTEGLPAFRRFLLFYEKRIKRLLPALLLFVTVGMLSISLFSREPTVYLKTGLTAIFGASNLYLYIKSTDYWGMDAEMNPFTHTWSLGVEEQFYFIYPILLIFLTRKKTDQENFKFLGFVMVALAIASVIFFVGLREKNFTASYFLMPFRFWEMALGCLAYFGLKSCPAFRLHSSWVPAGGLGVLIALCVLFYAPSSWGVIPPLIAPILTLALIVILVSLNNQDEKNQPLLTTLLLLKPVQYLGKISYSLYLWHWLVLALARWTIGISLVTAPVLVLAMLAFASLSYHFVEQPLRHKKWFPNKKSLVGFSVAALVLLASFALLALKPSLQKKLYAGQKNLVAEEQLIAAFSPEPRPVRCQKIRLLGNSHARHWLPMFQVLAKPFDIEVLSYRGKNSVSIPSGTKRQLPQLDGILEELGEGDLLILSNRNHVLYRIPYVVKNGAAITQPKGDQEGALKIWFEELDVVLEKAGERGVEVIAFLPTPEFTKRVMSPELYQKEWFRLDPSALGTLDQQVSQQELEQRFSPKLKELLYSYAERHEHFRVFDPNPNLRNSSGDYHVMREGAAVFSDTDHLSPYGSLLLLEPFSRFLEQEDLL